MVVSIYTHKGKYLGCPIYLGHTEFGAFTDIQAVKYCTWWFAIVDFIQRVFLAPMYEFTQGEPCPWGYYVHPNPMPKSLKIIWVDGKEKSREWIDCIGKHVSEYELNQDG